MAQQTLIGSNLSQYPSTQASQQAKRGGLGRSILKFLGLGGVTASLPIVFEAGYATADAIDHGITEVNNAQQAGIIAQHNVDQAQHAVTQATTLLPGARAALAQANTTVTTDQVAVTHAQQNIERTHDALHAAQQILLQDQHGNYLQQLKARFIDPTAVNTAQTAYQNAVGVLRTAQKTLAAEQGIAAKDAGIVSGYRQIIMDGPTNIATANQSATVPLERARDSFNTFMAGAAHGVVDAIRHIPIIGNQIVNSPPAQQIIHLGQGMQNNLGTIALVSTLPAALLITYTVYPRIHNGVADRFSRLLDRLNAGANEQTQWREERSQEGLPINKQQTGPMVMPRHNRQNVNIPATPDATNTPFAFASNVLVHNSSEGPLTLPGPPEQQSPQPLTPNGRKLFRGR